MVTNCDSSHKRTRLMDGDLLSSAAPSGAVVAGSCCTCSTFFFFFFALGLLVLTAAERSPKMSSVLPNRSSSDRPFGAFGFGFLLAVLCSKDIFCRLRLEGEKEGKVREVGMALRG